MSVPNAVLKAAVLKLQQDPVIIAKLGSGAKVFNNVPQDPDSAGILPYIVVRAQPVGPFGDKTANGWTVDLSAEIYSGAHGDKEALEIAPRIRVLFDGPRLSLESGRVVCSSFNPAEWWTATGSLEAVQCLSYYSARKPKLTSPLPFKVTHGQSLR